MAAHAKVAANLMGLLSPSAMDFSRNKQFNICYCEEEVVLHSVVSNAIMHTLQTK